jgi:hypothetical protein
MNLNITNNEKIDTFKSTNIVEQSIKLEKSIKSELSDTSNDSDNFNDFDNQENMDDSDVKCQELNIIENINTNVDKKHDLEINDTLINTSLSISF